MKDHCNKNMQKLMEELQYMEMVSISKKWALPYFYVFNYIVFWPSRFFLVTSYRVLQQNCITKNLPKVVFYIRHLNATWHFMQFLCSNCYCVFKLWWKKTFLVFEYIETTIITWEDLETFWLFKYMSDVDVMFCEPFEDQFYIHAFNIHKTR